MTLRTAVCVYHRGRLAVAQRIPRGKGTPQENNGGFGVLRFLWEPGNIERLRTGFEHVATLTREGRELETPFQGSGVDLLKTIATAEKCVPIWPDIDFATDCWCDWAYLVDLDQNTFEVYVLGGRGWSEYSDCTYLSKLAEVDDCRGPCLLKRFSFSQLPATTGEFIDSLAAVIKERGVFVSGYKWAP